MERLVKQAAQKVKQSDKTLAKRLRLLKNSKEFTIRKNREAARRYETSLYKAEQKRRQDQWSRGPLAARREVGADAKFYGTFDAQFFAFQKEFDARKPEWFHLAQGDRVVVLKGRDTGKISEVMNVNKDSCTIRVKDCNKMEIQVPEMLKAQAGGQEIIQMEREIPLNDVRLVFPLPNATTGQIQDTIIDKVEPIGRTWDRHKRELSDGERLIPGTTMIIPWPEKKVQEQQDTEADTRSDLVDQVTFRPHLLTAPMPINLIDELRNKYSRFRTRHSYEFVQAVEATEARKERRKSLIKTMQTPLQKVAQLRADINAANKKELSESQIKLIRQVMAQPRPAQQTARL